MNRKRASRLGTITSNVAIAATVFLFIAAFSSIMVTVTAVIAIMLWFAFTVCLLGIPLLNETWRGLFSKLQNTVEFGGAMVDFMLKLTTPLAVVSISFAVIAPLFLFLRAGENKQKAVPRTIISVILVIVSAICIIFARNVK